MWNISSRDNCKQCRHSCNAPFKLKRCMRVHSGVKPFVCSQCNYSCSQAGNLRNHMGTHSWEKPYNCNQCNYSCTTASDLLKHTLNHSGEKTYFCTQCISSFSRRDVLNQRMSTHLGEKHFSCAECNYSSNNAGSLRSHMWQYTGKKPYVYVMFPIRFDWEKAFICTWPFRLSVFLLVSMIHISLYVMTINSLANNATLICRDSKIDVWKSSKIGSHLEKTVQLWNHSENWQCYPATQVFAPLENTQNYSPWQWNHPPNPSTFIGLYKKTSIF